MCYKPLPIGVDDFKEIIKNNYFYVDKTLLIKDFQDKLGKVNLFTRPRRFGKTLNMSMLKYFFEIPIDGNSNKEYFKGLKILDAGEKYTSKQEQYPVIFLTLKSAKQPNWNLSFTIMKRLIGEEYNRHKIIMKGDFPQSMKDRYEAIMLEKADQSDYVDALRFLSQCLYEYYKKTAVILIDEYDVPLENAYYSEFYNEMITFIHSLFESALKTNPYLEFSVITGCLRISKESIFTGLNNLKINTILSANYGEYFGFLESEVQDMLNHYEREEKMSTMKEWYDGYIFGDKEVYNPWSIINYIDQLVDRPNAFPTASWSNTSSNSIVKDLIARADSVVKEDIEELIHGKSIRKKVHEDLTYEDIYSNDENLWNFLFFTGYLKMTSMEMEGVNRYVTMTIPNKEVQYIYENTIENWFREEIAKKDLTPLYTSMLSGDVKSFQEQLDVLLQKSISYMDSKETFYHGFLLGILTGLKEYIVKSNRESGNGRYDILVYHLDERIPPVVIELKVSPTFKEMVPMSRVALAQIKEKSYDMDLVDEGYTETIRYGIGFYKKKCRISMERKKLQLL